MKAATKGLMTIALIAAAAACNGSPTTASAFVSESDGIAMAGATSLTFSHTPSYDYATRTEQSASGGVGSISYAGHVRTPHPCFNVSASRIVRQTEVTVTVSARDNGNTCMQTITYQNYTGAVAGLEPGTYTFIVVHELDGAASTAYTGPVTVQ